MEFGIVRACARAVSAVRTRLTVCRSLLIKLGEYRFDVLGKLLGRSGNLVVIFGVKSFFGFLNRIFNGGFILFAEFVSAVFNGLFNLEDKAVEFVLVFDGFFSLLIFGFVHFRFLNGFLNIFFRKVCGGSDGDVRGFLSSEVFCRYVNDTVRVDIEGNFDLRDSSRSRSDARKIELTEGLVVFCELSFALKNVNGNFRLVIRRRGEYLRFLNGDGGVLIDKFGEHAAERFDTERQRRYVEKKNVLNFAR